MKKIRRKTYKAARVMGDIEAVASGKPDRIIKRLANKWIGRKIIWRLWRR